MSLKVLVIEPHPDDACLSIYFHLLKLKNEGMSVYLGSIGNSVYGRSSKKFCNNVGVTFVDISCSDDVDWTNRIPLSEIRNSENPYIYQQQYYYKEHGISICKWTNQTEALCKEVNPDLIVTCVGVYHPMHVLTRLSVDTVTKGTPKKYFVDLPYAFRKYGQKIVKSSNHITTSTLPLEGTFLEEEVKEKLSVFSKCYPSELGTLRFERDNFRKHREELMETNEICSSV